VKDKSALSVAIITRDEEENLPSCLKSVAFAEQIVVVDSGSADGHGGALDLKNRRR